MHQKSSKKQRFAENKQVEELKGLRVSKTRLLPEVLENEISKFLGEPGCQKATKDGKLCDRQFWYVSQEGGITPTPENKGEYKVENKVEKLNCSRFCIDFNSEGWLRHIFTNVPGTAIFVNNQEKYETEVWSSFYSFNFILPEGGSLKFTVSVKKFVKIRSVEIDNDFQMYEWTLELETSILWLSWLTRNLEFTMDFHFYLNELKSFHDKFLGFDSLSKPRIFFGPNSKWTLNIHHLSTLNLQFQVPTPNDAQEISRNFVQQLDSLDVPLDNQIDWNL